MKNHIAKTSAATMSIALMVSLAPLGAAAAANADVSPSPTAVSPTATQTPKDASTPTPASPASPSDEATQPTQPQPLAIQEQAPGATPTIDTKARKRLTAKQRKIAKSRIVWGFASIGTEGAIRGAKVTVRSVRNKPLKANVITKKTNKRGFYAVSRLGLPKRFVVVISGGKVPVKVGNKTVLRATKATLRSAVAKSKSGFARHTAAHVTLGTTVAALTGVKKYRNAGDSRAVTRARKALRLPAHATLGTYDRVLPHYLSAKKVRAKAKSKGSLTRLVNALVKQASRNARMASSLGEGVPTKYRAKPTSQGENESQSVRGGMSTRDVDNPGDVMDEAVSLVSTAYPYVAAGVAFYKQIASILGLLNSGPTVTQELAAINAQLTQMSKQLDGISSQLTTLQDETATEFAELSLQLSQTQYDVLAAGGTSIAAQANYAMQQMQVLNNIATPENSHLMPVQISEVNTLISNLSASAASTTLQRDLVGGSSSPGILGSAWSLIQQSRGVAAPATAPNPTAATTLLTHENYDTFAPIAAQWYLAQVQLSLLMTNNTMSQNLGDDNADGWQLAGNSYQMTANAQSIYNLSMNGACSSTPCPGSFNSYLDVLANSMPRKTLGNNEAIDTTTGLKWGNFGVVNWNAAATQPAVSSPDLTRPPTATVTCDGQTKQLELDSDFFKTVNGADGGCAWPGAPVGGPIGSKDTATDWQMLSSEPGSGGTYGSTLGNLSANIRSGGTGLLSQIDNSTKSQRANPSLQIPGVNAADFTSPSLFPDTGWGRYVYSKGPWQQFMWNDDGTAREAGRALFPWHNVVPARKSAGDFLVFDILNPTAPSMAAPVFNAGCMNSAIINPPPAGYKKPSCYPAYGTGASLIASDLPWADYAASFDYIWDGGSGGGLSDPGPSNRSFEGNVSYAFKDSTDPAQQAIAGLAAPWWPVANYSRDGDLGSSRPATPGCSNSPNLPWRDHGYERFEVGQTCSASVIGTRQVTVSDYEWQPPASIG